MLKRRIGHNSPTTSRDFRFSGQISSTLVALPPWSFLTTSVTSAWVMKESKSPVSAFTSEGVTAKLSLTASLNAGVHHRVQGLLLREASQTLRPQLRAAALTIEVENIVNSDSMSPTSPGIWSKLSQRCTQRCDTEAPYQKVALQRPGQRSTETHQSSTTRTEIWRLYRTDPEIFNTSQKTATLCSAYQSNACERFNERGNVDGGTDWFQTRTAQQEGLASSTEPSE
ncbi:hypothetical protein ATANTOWER_021258 [Ataeniobius toweri]|uniref:Uncharacterized protein n=1 Tax=Ataeniobius toweri TaxID=208326 RepID=A0ABU7BRI1_9TELE|nr:hypothetical protein [Ataeniobius toweri]